ncbi:MAG: methyltransferase domain-containing protein [Polyangiaceae bacterium]|nr:methyltransferase domain-containing protein [Polyangiaceae bacterium]
MSNDDRLARMRRDLREGAVDDETFDRLYATPIRERSARFWTPVAVARRAAELFASQGARRVLDVGSGPGKLCLVAACVRPEIELTGVEQRPHLVDAARLAKARLGVMNAQFFAGDATTTPWLDFDGVYLYNPFAENLFYGDDPLDRSVELSVGRLVADVRRVVAALAAAPVGTCMVTYNGFGGPVPATYDLAHAERTGLEWLRLWVKRRDRVTDGVCYREDEDGVALVSVAAATSDTPEP